MESDSSGQEDNISNGEGVEVDKNFLSNPYMFDPVIEEGAPVHFDVQGSTGIKLFNQYLCVLLGFISPQKLEKRTTEHSFLELKRT